MGADSWRTRAGFIERKEEEAEETCKKRRRQKNQRRSSERTVKERSGEEGRTL
jgi:hypothetical protein